MSQAHEPTNEQLYETYPAAPNVRQPSQSLSPRGNQSLDARLDRIEDALTRRQGRPDSSGRGPALALAIVSMVMAVPLTAIALGIESSTPGRLILLLVVWLGIVGVNVAFALGGRRRDPAG